MNWQPDATEIEELLAAHTLTKYEADDDSWVSEVSALESKWKREFYKSIIKRWIGRSIKSVANVKGSYTQVWDSDMYYPGSEKLNALEQNLIWRDEGYKVNGWVEKRIHLLLFLRAFEHLKPESILEVGSGNGAMSMMLASMYPDAAFQGIELTDAGVNAAQAIQNKSVLPEGMKNFLPAPVKDPNAFQKVDFTVGNAAKLPFKDDSIDLVFTSLALEQMNQVRDAVLNEISRVAKYSVVMIEPFPDFNQSPVQRLYTRARDYFSVQVSQLESYGILPELVFDDFPVKTFRGAGMIVAACQKHNRNET